MHIGTMPTKLQIVQKQKYEISNLKILFSQNYVYPGAAKLQVLLENQNSTCHGNFDEFLMLII